MFWSIRVGMRGCIGCRSKKFVGSIAFALALAATAWAQEPAHPKPCLGYNPFVHDWGFNWKSDVQICAGSYGYFSLKNPRQAGPWERVVLSDNCCPLPTDDMLLPARFVTIDTCPENFIITGVQRGGGKMNWGGVLVHCVRLNTERFQIGAKVPGVFWGVSSELALWYRSLPRNVMRANLPASIRYGVGRRGLTDWDISGCVGIPYGSLLVSLGGRRCADYLFARVDYRGRPGDPPAGTPVAMLPPCDRLSDIFDEHAVCKLWNEE